MGNALKIILTLKQNKVGGSFENLIFIVHSKSLNFVK